MAENTVGEIFNATHKVTGESFDIPLDLLKELTTDYANGFKHGYAKAYSKSFNSTIAIGLITSAVLVGVTYGTTRFLEKREVRKQQDTTILSSDE